MQYGRLGLFAFALPLLTSIALAGCDCAGPTPEGGPGAPCTRPDDCRSGLQCVDRTCQMRPDGALPDGSVPPGDAGMCAPERACRSGTTCCAEGEECVDDFVCDDVCEFERCGDNGLICCASGQVCLDGVVCAAACEADRALCGVAFDTCCDAGQVCVESACVTPGDACGDDFDCLMEGTYCEAVIGRCLPNPSPPLCELRPDFDDVALEVEWHWDGVDVGGTRYENVVATPIVGDVSGDGIPDVIVPVYAGSSLTTTILVALSGDDGRLLWRVGPGARAPSSLSTVAVANLDPSDDALEIVYRESAAGLTVLDGDGTTVLARVTTGSAATTRVVSPAIADLDQDGVLEIVGGCQALSFESDGAGGFMLRSRFDLGACAEPSQTSTAMAIANLDADPELEITSGAIAINVDGSILWGSVGGDHGIPAVADLDVDGSPEVINVRGGQVTVVDGATGAMRIGPGGTWFGSAVAIPGGGRGGSPTVADFDADGLPELSAAGQGQYAVYDLDCLPTPPRVGGDCAPGSTDLLRWAATTQDISSSVTGSSVFDFQGDGVAEVVYNDECFLHVYDGATGREVLMEPRPNSSRTGLEYPIVVDVDRDGNSEIVVPANSDQAVGRDNCPAAYSAAFGVPVAELPPEFRSGTHGVYVFGDPMDRWVRTRPIWNQFTYHVTHVTDRGVVPMVELDNWRVEGLNNYRQNVQGAGVFNAPNMTVTLESVAQCGLSQVRLSAVVTNAGSRGVPAGVQVEFVQLLPAPERVLDTRMTSRPLLPGESERITITVPSIAFDVDLSFEARVDGDTSSMPVLECNEDDNTAGAMELCPGLG